MVKPSKLANVSSVKGARCDVFSAFGALVEGKRHRIFSDKRIHSNREFFRADANQVKEAIQLAELKEVTPKVDLVVDASDVQALQRAVAT